MEKFKTDGKISDFQEIIVKIYGEPNDRIFSLADIQSNVQRFTMRALKGVRKENKDKIKENILIAFSWMVSLANRLHINIEDELWRRFPNLCSYCGEKPCVCKKTKPEKRKRIKREHEQRPGSLSGFQRMFEEIYPSVGRDVWHAGVHLAEETGEVSEAITNFMGEHKERQFNEMRDEIADWVSCMFGLANSAGINVAQELARMYKENCHVCHKSPCVCKFSFVASFRS